MRAAIIINPVSGRHGVGTTAGRRRAELARRVLDRRGIDGDVALTEGPGHAHELAGAFLSKQIERIVAWGGDGTINEVAGALVGTTTTLGIVPAGSGDGVAGSLRLSLATEPALEVALSGRVGAIDVGFLGSRHFLNIGGIGFDAAVGRAFNMRRTRGGLGYLTGGLSMAWSYQCVPYRLRLDDQEWSGERFLVVFANGREYGNHIPIAPDADPSDGWLDVVAVDRGPFLRQLWRARRLIVGRRKPAEGVYRTRVRTASVSGDVLMCHVDGEAFETSGMLEVRIQPKAIQIAGFLTER